MSRGQLEIRSLRKSYGGLDVLKGIDLDVSSGEFVTLLGPSGSGKTTVLMAIAGFQQADAGRIAIDGRDVTALPAHERNVGVVFQQYALFPHLTIRDNIAYPLRMRRLARAEIERRVSAALDAVQLSGVGDRMPNQLSGGQQQRIAVARATVYEPPLLLMDEPLSALDKSLRQDLQTEIRRMHRDLSTSIVYVTHDQEEALGMSDRIAVVNEGRIVQIDTPETIYHRPATRFVASFVGQSNFLGGRYLGGQDGRIGRCRLHDGTEMAGVVTGEPAVDDDVTLMVRPEHMKVCASGGVGARLEELVYQGRHHRCLGRFVTGERCLLELSGDSLPSDPAAPFNVCWEPGDAVILAE